MGNGARAGDRSGRRSKRKALTGYRLVLVRGGKRAAGIGTTLLLKVLGRLGEEERPIQGGNASSQRKKKKKKKKETGHRELKIRDFFLTTVTEGALCFGTGLLSRTTREDNLQSLLGGLFPLTPGSEEG